MNDLFHFKEDLAESLGPWTYHHSIATAVVLVFTLGIAGWQQLAEWLR